MVKISIGTPKKEAKLLLDIGSDISWINSNIFQKEKSTTLNDKKTNVTKIFYDIDIKGQWVKDVFTFLDEDFLIENFDFILTTEYKGNTALNGGLSLANKYLNKEFCVLHRMKQMQLINHEMFSLKFIDRTKGKIYIGDLSPELKNQKKLFDQCVLQKSEKVAEKIKWACQLTQIFIGELSNKELMFGQMEKVYKISKENHPMIDDINQRAEFETTVNRILLPSSEEEYLSFFEEYFFLNDKHKKICSKIKKETETSFECQIDEITFLKNVNFVFDNRIALFIYKEDLFDCDIKTNKCIFLISIREDIKKFVFCTFTSTISHCIRS